MCFLHNDLTIARCAIHHNESTKLKTLELREICYESPIYPNEQGSEAQRYSAKGRSV